MKYLKTFEGWEFLVPKEEQFNGLTKEFIEDMFIDISDEGYDMSVYFDKRAITSVDKEEGKMIINAIPYIWVRMERIVKIENPKNSESLLVVKYSDVFKEMIDIANDRLGDFGWYVSDSTVISNHQIRIFIHRIEDKKYVV